MQGIDKNTRKRLTAVLAIICCVLQLSIAPNLPFFGGRANFMLIYAALMAQLFGGRYGVIAGFLAGLFFDFCSTSPIGLMALLLTVCAYVLGYEVRNKLADDLSVSVTQFSIAALAVSAAYALALVLVEDAGFFQALFMRALPTAIITVICYLPFVSILSRNRTNFTVSPRRGGSNRLH